MFRTILATAVLFGIEREERMFSIRFIRCALNKVYKYKTKMI